MLMLKWHNFDEQYESKKEIVSLYVHYMTHSKLEATKQKDQPKQQRHVYFSMINMWVVGTVICVYMRNILSQFGYPFYNA